MGVFSYIISLSEQTMELLYSKAAVVLIILLLGFILGKLSGKIVKKILYEISLNRIIRIVFGIRLKADSIIAGTVSFGIYFISIIYALDKLGLEKAVMNIIVWGTLLIIIASFVLGIKDFIPNLFAGLVIHKRHYFSDGDLIAIGSLTGRVIDSGMIETVIETKKKDIIYIPNSFLLKNKITKQHKKQQKV